MVIGLDTKPLEPTMFPKTNDFNDDLSDLTGSPSTQRADYFQADNGYKSPVLHTEKCPACRGSGKFVSYSGRIVGNCFKCKGKGERTFRTSSQARAQARTSAADRKVRTQEETLAAFAAEHKAEHAWLITTAPRWDVARDLLASVMKYGSLTEKQMGLVRNGIARDAARVAQQAERIANAPAVDASKIEAAFAIARAKAARPGQMGVMIKPLRLKSGDTTLSFQPGSPGSKWEGMLFAKTSDGKKLGSIKDGKFTARFECTEIESAAVLDAASNPEQAAIAYGKAWSRCAICNRTLTNDESIARAMGPDCASKFGW